MHDCPYCDRKCSCDMEDAEMVSCEWVWRYCTHECEDDEDEDDLEMWGGEAWGDNDEVAK